MTPLFLITHLSAVGVGVLLGAGAVTYFRIPKAETLAELRGLRARLITLSPEEAVRHSEGAR